MTLKAGSLSGATNRVCAFVRPFPFPQPRVLKGIEVAKELGFEVTYLGAIRSKGQSRWEVWAGIPIRRLGMPYPESSLLYLVGTPIYVVAVFLWLLMHRPSVVHASDVEGMAGVALYRLVGGRARTLFNIHDNLALRYRVPRWLRWLLARFEALIGRFADVVLAPDEERLKLLRPWVPARAVVIPNSPPDPGFTAVRPTPPVRLFAAGWLSWRRGFHSLGELLRIREDVELVVCGSGPKEVLGFLHSLSRCEYRGFVPQREALAFGASCHLLVALYDPVVEINRYASSNKIFDAMALGRPIVINHGIAVAEWVRTKGVGFVVPYGDVQALSNLVDKVERNPDLLVETGRRGRILYERDYDWAALKTRLAAVFVSDGDHILADRARRVGLPVDGESA